MLPQIQIKPLGPHALHYKALSAEHVRPQVYFDIESADKTYGRMVFELAVRKMHIALTIVNF